MKTYETLHVARGVSILEMLVAIGIFSLLIGSIMSVFLSNNRYRDIILEQLLTQSEGRKAVGDFINDVRRANYSSIGAYPIVTAGTSTIVFYADIDGDTFREKVRYFLDKGVLKKGVTKPVGTPLSYSQGASEVITEETHSVANTSTVFYYYDQNYAGTSTPMTQPVTTTAVRLVEIRLVIERDPNKSPVPLYVQTKTEIRNLKSN